MSGLPVTTVAAVWFALVVIGAVGASLILQKERRRGDDARARVPLAEGLDPATLRRNRPTTARLSGTALLVAVFIIIGAFRAPLGLE